MQHMDQSTVDMLWSEILREVDRIKKIEHRDSCGSVRSEAMAHSNGKTLSAILDLTLPDGSHVVYHIQATRKTLGQVGPEVSISYKKYYHNAEDFWDEQLRDRSNAIVINHTHYRIGEENSSLRSGFGGRKYKIEFKDGRTVTTNNLWYQGVIPPALWNKFPDNAHFVDGG